ncbi:MAG TPA: sensor histidine kinase [Nitrososphaera sp.]|nr:sensor histidine kinase [Nitrososphaera sp.]
MLQSSNGEKPRYLLRPAFRTIGIISVVAVSTFSLVLFFYLQELTRNEVRTAVFEQHKDAQIEATRRMSDHIGTDLNLIVNTVEGLTNSYYLQRGDLSSKNAKDLIEEKYKELSPRISSLLILDKNNIVAVSLAPSLGETFLSSDFSQRQWVIETRESRKPMYSDGFERQGIYRIFISYPIISRESQEILGIVAVSIPTVPYFAYYANVHDINSQFLVAMDKEGTLLAVGASQDLVGDPFFGEETQAFINHNPALNNLTRSLLAGNSGFGLYDYGNGERFTTQYPVHVRGQALYFIQLVSPTADIYSEVDSSLKEETAKLFLILSGTVLSIGILSLLLLKWNGALSNEVGERTRQLAVANERLEINLQAQKEFLEVAAHELRTPVQPILGLAEALHAGATKAKAEASGSVAISYERQLLEVILRNAQRLKNLTENLLDVSRIDSGTLRLNTERFDLSALMAEVMQELRNSFGMSGTNVNFVLKPSESVMVNADKNRLVQVVYNLLNNSQKFTKKGTIEIGVTRDVSDAIVTVCDDGDGLSPEVLPVLFVKFISRSDGGTGLGLYISKGIVEAHGGRIWAENNNDGKGASFHFAIPLDI